MQKNVLIASILALVVGVFGGYAVSLSQPEKYEPTQNTLRYGQGIGSGGQGEMMQNGRGGMQQFNRNNCLAEDCLLVDDLEYPVGDLEEEVVDALTAAIVDEYTAHATYEAVIAEFGSVRPFSMIIRSEEQHIASLKAIFDKYGVEIPDDTINATVPDSLQEACQIGVDAEIANASLYRDELLPSVSEYPDITVVFTNLMNASQNNHLRAFDRCN